MNEEIRQLFPVTQNYIYLNHAAIAPYSTLVATSLNNIVNDITERGSVNWHNWLATMNETRRLAAQLVNAQTDNIAFVRNTSDGIAAVANGIDWQNGDNVVSCDIEFPANIYPWMRLKSRGVELLLAPAVNGRIDPADLFKLVDERTRVIALSWVQYASGFRADLRAIGQFCRERDILFFVDAIQGLGALKLDVEQDFVDAFAADAHKYLMGPEGLGVLFISDRAIARVEPAVVGWMSVKEWWRCFDAQFEYKLDYLPGALRFECGTPNTVGLHGLHASLSLMLKVGTQQIEDYLLDLCADLKTALAGLGFELLNFNRRESSAIVCARHDKHAPEYFYKQLSDRKIITAPRCGYLRISPHFYNNRADIDGLITALKNILEG